MIGILSIKGVSEMFEQSPLSKHIQHAAFQPVTDPLQGLQRHILFPQFQPPQGRVADPHFSRKLLLYAIIHRRLTPSYCNISFSFRLTSPGFGSALLRACRVLSIPNTADTESGVLRIRQNNKHFSIFIISDLIIHAISAELRHQSRYFKRIMMIHYQNYIPRVNVCFDVIIYIFTNIALREVVFIS